MALVAYIDGVKQSEAAERLAEFLGIKLEKSDLPKRATRAQSPAAEPTYTSPSKSSAMACVVACACRCPAATQDTPETWHAIHALAVS